MKKVIPAISLIFFTSLQLSVILYLTLIFKISLLRKFHGQIITIWVGKIFSLQEDGFLLEGSYYTLDDVLDKAKGGEALSQWAIGAAYYWGTVVDADLNKAFDFLLNLPFRVMSMPNTLWAICTGMGRGHQGSRNGLGVA